MADALRLMLPKEHGSWSLALEPVALGLLVAPSAAGAALAAAAVSGFFLRRPWKLMSGAKRDPRQPLAVAWVGILALIALAVVVVAIDDASFLGGWRPMDGGDEGLFYTGVGRNILEQLLAGNIGEALKGDEAVFYYGGPALRYFRALEMVVFGDTNLGYLSLVLFMPVIVWRLFARFLDETFAWRLALLFTVLPLGEIFGTSFFHYAKWAGRGFADPVMHICLLWGILVIAGQRRETERAVAALGGAFLLALAVCTKPVVAPMAGIILTGAGLMGLYRGQWARAVALCIGFSPVLLMPLHNWVFGHQFVLLSTNANLPSLQVMPPAAWLAALGELATLHWGGAELHRAVVQLGDWLSGPSGLKVFIPLHAAAVATVVWVALRGRSFDPWLRIIAVAVIAEYGAALFYAATARYFFSMWFLTLLVVLAVIARKLPAFLDRHGYKRSREALERSFGYSLAKAS